MKADCNYVLTNKKLCTCVSDTKAECNSMRPINKLWVGVNVLEADCNFMMAKKQAVDRSECFGGRL